MGNKFKGSLECNVNSRRRVHFRNKETFRSLGTNEIKFVLCIKNAVSHDVSLCLVPYILFIGKQSLCYRVQYEQLCDGFSFNTYLSDNVLRINVQRVQNTSVL